MPIISTTPIHVRYYTQAEFPLANANLAVDTSELVYASDTGRLTIGASQTYGNPFNNRTYFPYNTVEVLTELSPAVEEYYNIYNRNEGAEVYYQPVVLPGHTTSTIMARKSDGSIPELILPSTSNNISVAVEYHAYVNHNPIKSGTLRVLGTANATSNTVTLVDYSSISNGSFNFVVNYSSSTGFVLKLNNTVGNSVVIYLKRTVINFGPAYVPKPQLLVAAIAARPKATISGRVRVQGAMVAKTLAPVAVVNTTVASLSLQFINSSFVANTTSSSNIGTIPGWSFSRASVGYAQMANGALVSFGSGVPRITNQGLLIEPAATNQLLQSNNFTNTWGISGLTFTSSATVAPDGTTTGWSVTEGATSSSQRVYQSVTVASGSTQTVTIFLKQGTGRYVQFGLAFSATGAYATVDLSSGTITQSGASGGTLVSATVTPSGNGWYRLTVVGTITSQTTYYAIVALTTSPTPGYILGGATSYAGTGLYNYIWGAQMEAGSIATSYIPTTTAAVTRAADNASMNLTIGAQGTTYAEWIGAPTGITYPCIVTTTGTIVPILSIGSSSPYPIGVYNSGILAQSGAATSGLTSKAASAFTSGRVAISGNGANVTNNTTTPAGWSSPISLGVNPGTSYLTSYIRNFTYYPTALPDTILQILSKPFVATVSSKTLAPSASVNVAQPNLALRFHNSSYFANATATSNIAAVSGWSFSRASVAYASDLSGNLIKFASNTPRITNQGLLIENSATNLKVQSQAWATTPWTYFGISATNNSAIAPDGTFTASTLTEDTTTAAHVIAIIGDLTVTSGATVTASVYLTAGTRRYVQLSIVNGTFYVWATFDTQTGLITEASSSGGGTYISSSVTPVAYGYYRVVLTGALPGNTNYHVDVGGSNAASGVGCLPTYTGTNSTIIGWGMQAELGSYVTSYIPTTTATVTRAADLAKISNVTISTPATLYTSAVFSNYSAIFQVLGALTDGSTNNIFQIYRTNDAQMTTTVDIASNNTVLNDSTSSTVSTLKSAASFDGTTLKLSTNGAAPVSSAVNGTVTGNSVMIGQAFAGGTLQPNAYIKSLSIYNSAVDIKTLTATNDVLIIPTTPVPTASITVDQPMISLQFTKSTYFSNAVTSSNVANISGWSFSRASNGYASYANGVIVNFANNVPRITDIGMLIESSSTNVLLYSQAFENAAWTQTAIIPTAASTTAPDNTLTGELFTANGSTAAFNQTPTVAASTTYTASAYLKSGTSGWGYIQINNNGTGTGGAVVQYFNLSTCAVGSVQTLVAGFGAVTATATPAANGFCRVAVTVASLAGTTSLGVYFGPCDADTTRTVTNGNTIYGWGAQFEASKFASSYIPTTNAIVTRASDPATITGGFSATYPNAEIVFLQEGFNGGSQPLIVLKNASSGVTLYSTATPGKIVLYSSAGGGQIIGPTYLTNAATITNKVAYRTTSTDAALSINGSTPTVSNIAITNSALTTLIIGSDPFFLGGITSAYIQSITIANSVLSNAVLQYVTK